MAVSQAQITIPDDGSQVVIISGTSSNANQVNIRNTGTVTTLLGPQTVLSPPPNPVAAAVSSGGTFAAGSYYWAITSVNNSGESTPSAEVTATLIDNGSCSLAWDAVPGANNYHVYRAIASGDEAVSPALIVIQSAVTYLDVGDIASSGHVPSVNTAAVPVLFPLEADEYLGFTSIESDVLVAQVQTPGDGAGQLTVLMMG